MSVTLSDEQDDPVPLDELTKLAALVIDAEGLAPGTGMTVRMVDEATIAELNEQHLGRSGPTDVLSFPIEDASPGAPPVRAAGGPPVELGDIFIAPAVVAANARRDGVAYDDAMALMVVHGFLHLLGWDHVDDDDAVAMEKREGELLSLIGRDRP